VDLYIHIPFCVGKCAYCAFYSERYQTQKADATIAALGNELHIHKQQLADTETIYIGGGTPSTLSLAQWQQLSSHIEKHTERQHIVEWTVEANPGALSDPILDYWQAIGVTRVSLGVQSMNDRVLEHIGRPHSAHDVVDTVTLLRTHGFNGIGLDLIAGLPGVTDDCWGQTLIDVLSLHPDHISCYACSVEPGSRFYQHRHHPAFQPADEVSMERALDQADARLTKAGYEHYEISNYAQPGQRCLHNTNVWQGTDYIGVGPAAASRVGFQRWLNDANLDAYIKAAGHPRRSEETVSPETDGAERLAFRFRMADPVSLDQVDAQLGPAASRLRPYWEAQLHRLAQEGLLVCTDNRWSTTASGYRMADTIAEAILPPP
jgi:oxygen-independent coproporphyrinogen-3 oxidase